MDAPILVTGGTGNIGSRVVRLLNGSARHLRILSRHAHDDSPAIEHVKGDVVKGVGLDTALDGVGTVVHLAGGARGDDVAAWNLAKAAREAAVEHLVLISVIGADRMPLGYFRRKAEAEREFAESGVPWTILRAAQLHDFVLPMAKSLSGLRLAPRTLRLEPVDGDEVAQLLVDLALGAPARRIYDLAGPEVIDAATLVRAYNDTLGRRRGVHSFGIPGAIGRAYRAGENLAEKTARRGTITWRAYLENTGRVRTSE